MVARFIHGLMRMMGCMVAALLGVALLIIGSCSWMRYQDGLKEDQCSERKLIHVRIGSSSYVVPEQAVQILSPVEPTGVVLVNARDAGGQYRRYCQKKDVSTVTADKVFVEYPRPKS